MKITDIEIIKNAEKELIDSINGDLDWGIMEEIFRKMHKLELGEDVEYKRGDLVVHNNEVAYQLEFDVKVKLSILIDREGNYLSFSTAGEPYAKIAETENEAAAAPADGEAARDAGQAQGRIKNVLSNLGDPETAGEAAGIDAAPMPTGFQDRISAAAVRAGDIMEGIGNVA